VHTDHPYDALVVGARAAGAATAMLLARAGLRVLVVDRGRYGADTLSTHALMRGAVLQLHRWGLLGRVVDAGTPAVRRTTFHYAGDEVAITIKPSHGIDALYAPRRTVLDPILVDAAVAAGADVRYGVSVSDVRRDRHGRVIGVDARDGSGRRTSISAGIVIGADGLRSTIADRVGAAVQRRGRNSGAVVYGYWSDVDTDGYEWTYTPGYATGLIPTNDGLVCVYAGAPSARIGRGGADRLLDVVRSASQEIADRLAAGSGPMGVRSFAGAPGELRRAWGPGWALVGDAGYWKDPIGAHGLTDAFRDADLLARAVVSSASGNSTRDQALADYQAMRDALSIPLMTTADEIGGYRWDDNEIGPLLLRLSSAMAAEVGVLAALDALAPA
jgi:flavin-dependent dehydrogenase